MVGADSMEAELGVRLYGQLTSPSELSESLDPSKMSESSTKRVVTSFEVLVVD